MPSKKSKLSILVFILILTIIAAYLRFNVIVDSIVDHPIRADARDYYFYGYNLRAHSVFSCDPAGYLNTQPPIPDAIRAPGYGAFIASFMDFNLAQTNTLNGLLKSIEPVLFFQALLSVITVILIFLIACQFIPESMAFLVGILTAISPHLVNSNIYLLSESLYTFLLYLSFFLIIRYQNTKTFFIAGVTLALASLTRPTTEYLPFFVFVIIGCCIEKQQFKKWAIMLLFYTLTVSIWKIRNIFAIGTMSDPQLLSNTIHHGMYPNFMHNGLIESLGMPYRFDSSLAPGEKNIWKVLETLKERVLENKITFLKWYLLGKPIALFTWNSGNNLLVNGDIYIYPMLKTPYTINPFFIWTYSLSKFVYLPLIIIGWIASFSSLFLSKEFWGESWSGVVILSITVFYFIGIHMLGAPFPRYTIPFQPLFFLLAITLVNKVSCYFKDRYYLPR